MTPTHLLEWSDILVSQQYAAPTFFVDQNINILPVDPFQIALQNNWLVIPYDTAAQLMATSVEELEHSHGYNGFVFFDAFSEKYVICYDLNNSYLNIRFILCHEIAHIVLKHVGPDQPFVNIDPSLKDSQDILCDEFALELLCPYFAVKHYSNAHEIAAICNVSTSVASSALSLYKLTKKQTAEKM